MLDQYTRFFTASATASAAFIGLLLVALSIANQDDSEHRTRERRTVLAASAFLALIDIFFVSLASSLGGTRVLATASLIMALVGLLGTSRLMPRARRAGNFAQHFPKRNLNFAFATVAVTGYSTQFGIAVALLINSRSSALTQRSCSSSWRSSRARSREGGKWQASGTARRARLGARSYPAWLKPRRRTWGRSKSVLLTCPAQHRRRTRKEVHRAGSDVISCPPSST